MHKRTKNSKYTYKKKKRQSNNGIAIYISLMTIVIPLLTSIIFEFNHMRDQKELISTSIERSILYYESGLYKDSLDNLITVENNISKQNNTKEYFIVEMYKAKCLYYLSLTSDIEYTNKMYEKSLTIISNIFDSTNYKLYISESEIFELRLLEARMYCDINDKYLSTKVLNCIISLKRLNTINYDKLNKRQKIEYHSIKGNVYNEMDYCMQHIDELGPESFAFIYVTLKKKMPDEKIYKGIIDNNNFNDERVYVSRLERQERDVDTNFRKLSNTLVYYGLRQELIRKAGDEYKKTKKYANESIKESLNRERIQLDHYLENVNIVIGSEK